MSARHKLRTLTRYHVLLLVGAVAAALFLLGSVVWAQWGQQQAQGDLGVVAGQRDAERSAKENTAAQAQQAVDPVLELCAQGDAVAQALRDRGACELAQQVAATPVPTQPPIPGPTGERGRPPTTEEIQAAVDAYLVAHPPPAGRPPNATEVAAAVASYLTANPPAPGRAPTAEEIAAAVAQYFADNPVRDGRDGQDGATGAPGRPPTAAEIDAAVAEWIAAHPEEVRGPPGADGQDGAIGCPAGTSLEPVEFASGESGLGCVDDNQPPDTTTAAPRPTTEPGEDPNTGGETLPGNP